MPISISISSTVNVVLDISQKTAVIQRQNPFISHTIKYQDVYSLYENKAYSVLIQRTDRTYFFVNSYSCYEFDLSEEQGSILFFYETDEIAVTTTGLRVLLSVESVIFDDNNKDLDQYERFFNNTNVQLMAKPLKINFRLF